MWCSTPPAVLSTSRSIHRYRNPALTYRTRCTGRRLRLQRDHWLEIKDQWLTPPNLATIPDLPCSNSFPIRILPPNRKSSQVYPIQRFLCAMKVCWDIFSSFVQSPKHRNRVTTAVKERVNCEDRKDCPSIWTRTSARNFPIVSKRRDSVGSGESAVTCLCNSALFIRSSLPLTFPHHSHQSLLTHVNSIISSFEFRVSFWIEFLPIWDSAKHKANKLAAHVHGFYGHWKSAECFNLFYLHVIYFFPEIGIKTVSVLHSLGPSPSNGIRLQHHPKYEWE